MLFTQRRGIRVLGSWDAACARMRLWNIETPSSGPRKLKHGWKLLAALPKKEGEASRQPHRRGLRPPCLPTLHATGCRNRRSLGPGHSANFALSEF